MICKITDKEYFAIDACSSSTLKTIYNKSVMHSLIEKQPTESMILGSAFHCLALEPTEFESRYSVMPEFYEGIKTKAGKTISNHVVEEWDFRKTDHQNFKKEFDEISLGRKIISHSDSETVSSMVQSLFKHPLSKLHLIGGKAESTIIHEIGDPEATKIKMDYVHYDKHIIIDLKSCLDASPQAIRRDIFKFSYDIQAAWYSTQYHCETGEAPTFLFAFVENVFPYAVCYVQLSPEILAEGLRKVNIAYKDYLEYRATGIAKGYSEDIVII